MANPEHFEILKQGVETWNQWRREHREIQPNLDGVNLRAAALRGVYFSGASLNGADFSDADLLGAHLMDAHMANALFNGAKCRQTFLQNGDFRGANFGGADIRGAYLIRADLRGADLRYADLSGAQLSAADLRSADLCGTTLNGVYLSGTNFHHAIIGKTTFIDTDLSNVTNLETVEHRGPSTISISTVYLSGGKIPESFLRGCGVPEDFITYMRSLTAQPIQFYSCFISYSSNDQEFAERLHADLQSKGVRVWFAPHDMPIGARIRPTIDDSIRVYDKLLLVLSEASVSSQWVEQEVETALAREREQEGRTVLFPIRVDDAIMEVKSGWPALLKNTRNVGDFTRWKEHDSYQKAFDKLLRDLKAEGKKA